VSDEPSTELSAELSTALREFAAEHETPTVLTGAEVRGRSVRRTRRRVAGTLGAGAVALALMAFALTLNPDSEGEGKQRQVPAAPPAVPTSSPPAASATASSPAARGPVAGTVDLGKRILTIGDRVMPMTSGLTGSRKLVGPMTVYSRKPDNKVLNVNDPTYGTRYNAEMSLAVELLDANKEPVYVGAALSYNKKDLGKYATSGGWISLDPADAKWFYTNVKTGSVLSLTGTAS
jgi:hypothetical protein